MPKILSLLLCVAMVGPAYGESLIDKVDDVLNDRTDILAIYKDNQLIYEEFRNGYQRDQKHKLWSMSKSIVSLVLANAVKEGRIELTDSICEYVSMTELTSPLQCDITIENILFWRSGVEWAENYIGLSGEKSSVLTGLYGRGIKDFSKYYFSLPYNPISEFNWNYSTGDSHILGYILKKVYSPMEYESLPWDKLFDPLGITDATFERDQSGTFLGGSYVFLSHPNLNRIAQFVLSEIRSPQDLPSFWMDHVLTAKSDSILNPKMIKDAIAPAIPGGHWWLNRQSNKSLQVVPWPKAPADTFAAFGVFGQMMFIIPSENLVIIRLAQDIKGGFDKARLIEVAREYAKEVTQ